MTTLAKPANYEPSPDAIKRHEEAEQRRAEQRREDFWKASTVPARHANATANLRQSKEWASKYDQLQKLLGTGFLVAMVGGRGTGKTQMGVELIRETIKGGKGARYTTAMEILMSVREAYRQDGPTERQQIEAFVRPQLLVVDEAHERSESDWENRLLAHLLDRRYRELRDTLILSNHDHKGFEDSIGKSIYSRLIEAGGIIVCNWPSFRGAK